MSIISKLVNFNNNYFKKSNTKKFPTHYELINTKKVKGSVLCEHIRSIDFNARNLSFVEKIKKEDLDEIIDIINGIIEL